MAMTDNGTPPPPPAPAPPPDLPTSVRVGGVPRLRPNELRVLKAATGKSLTDLLSDEADAIQAMVWLKLRRAGYLVTWDQAGEVEAEMADAEPPDPTKPEPSGNSPHSVATGG